MKIILWIAIILTATIIFQLNPWNNLSLNYFIIVLVILSGPVTATILLFRWIDEKAANRQLYCPGIIMMFHTFRVKSCKERQQRIL